MMIEDNPKLESELRLSSRALEGLHKRLSRAYDVAVDHGVAGNIHEARYKVEQTMELISSTLVLMREEK